MPGAKVSVQTEDVTSALSGQQLPNAGGEAPASSALQRGFAQGHLPASSCHLLFASSRCYQWSTPLFIAPLDLQLIPGDSLLPGCTSVNPSDAGGTVLAQWVGERRRVKLAELQLIRLESGLIAGCL